MASTQPYWKKMTSILSLHNPKLFSLENFLMSNLLSISLTPWLSSFVATYDTNYWVLNNKKEKIYKIEQKKLY